MHSAAAGPTGTAIRKPMAAPSMASEIGLKTKPGTFIAWLDFLGRKATRRGDQPILRRHQLQLALAERERGLEHGEDRRSGLAEGRGNVAAFEPMGAEHRSHRIAGSVGRDLEAD